MVKNELGFDKYKERGNKEGLYAEPTNLLSNCAFFAAALIAAPFCKGWLSGTLAAGMVLVGLGSSLYHSKPSKFTQMWDTGAIVAWVFFYLFAWAFFMIGFGFFQSIGILTAFGLISYLFIRKYGEYLNGSADYIPVIVLLLFCGTWVWFKLGYPHLVIAGVLASASLVCRVIDHDVSIPSGTHFLWHILNGFLMAMLTMFVAVYIES